MIKLYDDWNVQLAKTYKPGMIQPDTWISISQKINGVRATYFGGELISRTGHKLEGFYDIEKQCKVLAQKLGISTFDGELRIKPAYCAGLSDNEAFKLTTGIANTTKDYNQKYKLDFIIFDILSMYDWCNESCQQTYKIRSDQFNTMKRIIYYEKLDSLKIVPILYQGYDISQIEECSETALVNKWEGIMINLNRMYEYKRSSGLLKYKKFNTIDLKVVGMQTGIGKYEDVMGSVNCLYKDNIVSVGSGFTDAQREYFIKHQDEIIGKIIEVKYKDITSDKSTGLESLQFPVFQQIRRDKEVPDA